MTKYEIKAEKITLWVWYRNGLLTKLSVRKGNFRKEPNAWTNIARWVPAYESSIQTYSSAWPSIRYKAMSSNTQPKLYSALVADWFLFYSEMNGVEYKFTGIDGQAMKQIEKYLVGNFGEDAQATWQAILSKWNLLPEFYRKKADIVFVNAKLNEIITHLKHHDEAKSSDDSQDLRSKL